MSITDADIEMFIKTARHRLGWKIELHDTYRYVANTPEVLLRVYPPKDVLIKIPQNQTRSEIMEWFAMQIVRELDKQRKKK